MMERARADDDFDDFERFGGFESVLYNRSEWMHFYALSRRLWHLQFVWYDRKSKGFRLFGLWVTSVVRFQERGS